MEGAILLAIDLPVLYRVSGWVNALLRMVSIKTVCTEQSMFCVFQQRIADIEKNGCIEQRKFVAKHKAQVLNGKNMKETKP